MKKIAYDSTKMDALQIVEDSNCCLKVNAVISKAGVYLYDDGWALKPVMELQRATRTARYAKLTIGDHPESKVIMSQNQLYGGVESPYFERNKIRATLCFDKYVTPRTFIDNIKNAVTNKIPIDNSIGFFYTADFTPGIDADVNTGEKRHYDYIMRDIVIDHVVVVDKDGVKGRCTFPHCGVGVDTMMNRISFKEDKVVQRGDKWCVVHCHGEEEGEVIKCFATKEEAEAMHRAIQAQKGDEVPQIIGGRKGLSEMKPTEWEDFLKDRKAQGYTEQQAKDYWDAYVAGTKELIALIPAVPPSAKPPETVANPTPVQLLQPPVPGVKLPDKPVETTPKPETPPPPPPENLSAEQLIDRSKELLAMREQRVIEERRSDRRHPA